MKSINKLAQVLKRRFPEEETGSLATLLSIASKKEEVSYEEIKVKKETKDGLLLLAYNKRLLLPIRTSQVSRTLAWEDRILTPKPGEKYEMPNVIRYLIRKAEETGQWRPYYAVRRYLEDIGEPEADKILRLFQEVEKKVANSKILSKTNKISPQLLKACSEKLGLELDIDKTIAELKGGGIISPYLRNFSRFRIRYEINPSLVGENKM
jgi:hypothetical protein